jgi:hypothetical protein
MSPSSFSTLVNFVERFSWLALVVDIVFFLVSITTKSGTPSSAGDAE